MFYSSNIRRLWAQASAMEASGDSSSPSTTTKASAPNSMIFGTTTAVPNIEKLEGAKNYTSWSFAMKNTLIVCDLWDCVNSPAEYKTQVGDDDIFKRLDAKTMAKICLSLTPRVYPTVMSATTAEGMWKKLQAAYADSGLLRRLNLLRRLFNYKLSSFKSMEAYVSEIRATQQQLIEVNEPVDDEFVGLIMLTGLTEKFNPMVMAIENSGTKLTSDSVAAILLKEDLRYSQSKETDAALTVNSTKNSSLRPPVCTYCKKKGHLVSECRKRKCKKNVTNLVSNITDVTLLLSFTTPPFQLPTSISPWYLDSGATAHMCNDIRMFSDFAHSSSYVIAANNEKMACKGTGTVQLNVSNSVHSISNVLFVPKLAANLLSVSSLVQKGFVVIFSPKGATILLRQECKVSGITVATASNKQGMYKLDISENQAQLITDRKLPAVLWHRRLGHINVKAMNILKKYSTSGINYNDTLNEICIPCVQGKLAKRPFNKSKSKTKNKLELIHTDLCGPMSTHSWGGALYLLTFTDDFTRKTFGFLLKSKSEVFSKFVEFKHHVENQTGLKIKTLRSDNGGEFVNGPMSTFLQENGIVHQKTVPYNAEQNGTSERVNRTVIEKARTMLHDSKLPKAYWGEAVNTAIYLKNVTPTQALNNKIPDELWYEKPIDLSHLRVFGCEAHALIPKEKRTKLDSKTKACIFVGYSSESKGYRLIDPHNPRSIIVARDVIFIEDKVGNPATAVEPTTTTADSTLIYDQIRIENSQPVTPESFTDTERIESQPEVSEAETSQEYLTVETLQPVTPELFTDTERIESLPEVSEAETSQEYLTADNESSESASTSPETDSTINEPRYPQRQRRPPDRYSPSMFMVSDYEPETYKQAVEDVHSSEWQKAMKNEYDCLMKHGTWQLVERPTDRKIIKNKWVYKIKKNTNGEVVKFKARLVAKGFTQVHGIDYGETFSPVARLSSVRLLLAFAVQLNVQLDHLDVETAFLNGDLEEEIFMEQPPGFEIDRKGKVCLLKKSLYGLKQSPRQWNIKICEAMNSLSMTQAANEHCVYYRRDGNKILVVSVFVDDFFILCNNECMKETFKNSLKKVFIVKDLGLLKDCLGMRVIQTVDNITLDQTKYIEKIVEKFGMKDAIPISTPMEAGMKLTIPAKEDERPDLPYQQLIGSLMYISIGTRPDISHTVSYLSQFNVHYGEVHWKAAKRVLRYLKATKDLKLCFDKKEESYPIGYVDADYGSNVIDRRSYTGYAFKMSGACISWESRKQRTPALSTTEAEYMALTEACKEAIYMRSLIKEVFDVVQPITIHSDNQSSLKLTRNDTFHSRTKHIDIRHHFIRELSQTDFILQYISTNDMLADILTKSLTRIKHSRFTNALGLVKRS